jgi:hypothetical protein
MDRAAPRLPNRREVLVGGALLALAGCLPGSEPEAPRLSPDQRLRARVADEVDALAARYDAVIARFPAGRSQLSTLSAEHQAHARALRGRRTSSTTPSPSATPSASAPPAVPATLAAARAALAAAERAAARRRGRQARGCGPELARLLASIGACEATHAALLERAA